MVESVGERRLKFSHSSIYPQRRIKIYVPRRGLEQTILKVLERVSVVFASRHIASRKFILIRAAFFLVRGLNDVARLRPLTFAEHY